MSEECKAQNTTNGLTLCCTLRDGHEEMHVAGASDYLRYWTDAAPFIKDGETFAIDPAHRAIRHERRIS